MRSTLILLIIYSLTTLTIHCQSALFLMISPSATNNGMGETGVATASSDPSGLYYNPAAGSLPQHSGSLFSYQSSHSDWLPGLVDDMSIDHQAAMLQIAFPQKRRLGPLYIQSLTFGQYRTYLDAGIQQYISPNGEDLGHFRTYFNANNSVIGLGLSHKFLGLQLQTGVGLTYKEIYQHLTDDLDGLTGSAWSSAFDWGVLTRIRVVRPFDLFHKDDVVVIMPALGYSVVNIGDKVVFNDPEQADPLPRHARLGVSLEASLQAEGGRHLAQLRFERSALDYLVAYNSGTLSYQHGLGDINPLQHVWFQEGSDKVIVHQGFEWGLGDIFWARSGTYLDRRGRIDLETSGYEISLTGFLPLLDFNPDKPTILAKMARHLGLSYVYSHYRAAPSHPLYETEFETFRIELKHLDELLESMLPN